MSPLGQGGLSGPSAPALAPADLAWVCDLVRAETAVVLDASKEYLVASRLLPLARRGGFPDVGAYVSRMRSASPADRWELVEAMTTNETSWFRDVEPFTYLRTSLLPALATASRSTRSLRVWSAACSTGQEPYTIAMLAADAPELRGFRTEILATDVDRTALERARSATYSQMEVGRGLPADMVARHLERAGMQWRVREEVRSAVRFSELNLARPFPERGRFDVIFCRNVLIYFDTATKQQVLERLHSVLAPDGVLVLGAAETTLGISGSWARVEGSRAALYRPLGGSASAPVAPAPPAQAPVGARTGAGRPWGTPAAGRVLPPASPLPPQPSRLGARPPAGSSLGGSLGGSSLGSPRAGSSLGASTPGASAPGGTARRDPHLGSPSAGLLPRTTAPPPRAARPVVPPRAAPSSGTAEPWSAGAPPIRAAPPSAAAWPPSTRPSRPSVVPPAGDGARPPTAGTTRLPGTGATGLPEPGAARPPVAGYARPPVPRTEKPRAGRQPGSSRPDSGGSR